MGRTALIVACLLAFPANAVALKRMALVIGNSTYTSANTLPNPKTDATALAKLFTDAKFDFVELKFDLSREAFVSTLRQFADESEDADVAVIYYAGHGMEMGGVNYLIPVDAKLATDTAIADETVSLDRVLLAASTAKRLRLVILDACRNNPFLHGMRRSRNARAVGGGGLASVEVETNNTYVAFAAKAGFTADDGENHSPFAQALIAHLTAPGLDIRIALGRVRDEVLKETNGEQEPYVYGSLGGDVIALVPGEQSEQQTKVAESPTGISRQPVAKPQTIDLGTAVSLHGDWGIYCQRQGSPSTEHCALVQSVHGEQSDIALTTFLLRGTSGQLLMRVLVPPDVLLPQGLELRIDAGDIGKAGYTKCLPSGCVTEVSVDATLLAKLEKGKQAIFFFFRSMDDKVGVPVRLSGLAEGLANLDARNRGQ